jgi:hypothetical protein
MASKHSDITTVTVRDAKSGRFVTVKGAGALKGKMTISKGVDLTKPISGPARARAKSPVKHNIADHSTAPR